MVILTLVYTLSFLYNNYSKQTYQARLNVEL